MESRGTAQIGDLGPPTTRPNLRDSRSGGCYVTAMAGTIRRRLIKWRPSAGELRMLVTTNQRSVELWLESTFYAAHTLYNLCVLPAYRHSSGIVTFSSNRNGLVWCADGRLKPLRAVPRNRGYLAKLGQSIDACPSPLYLPTFVLRVLHGFLVTSEQSAQLITNISLEAGSGQLKR